MSISKEKYFDMQVKIHRLVQFHSKNQCQCIELPLQSPYALVNRTGMCHLYRVQRGAPFCIHIICHRLFPLQVKLVKT